MNKEQGFSLKPETYNQKEWYELFMNLSKEYRKKCNIINELEKYIKTEVKIELYKDKNGFRTFADSDDILNKLKALKEE